MVRERNGAVMGRKRKRGVKVYLSRKGEKEWRELGKAGKAGMVRERNGIKGRDGKREDGHDGKGKG